MSRPRRPAARLRPPRRRTPHRRGRGLQSERNRHHARPRLPAGHRRGRPAGRRPGRAGSSACSSRSSSTSAASSTRPSTPDSPPPAAPARRGAHRRHLCLSPPPPAPRRQEGVRPAGGRSGEAARESALRRLPPVPTSPTRRTPCSTPSRRRTPPRARRTPSRPFLHPTRSTPSGASPLLAAAETLLPVLEAGRALDAATLRTAMTRAFGASDAVGAWIWKDAYEAAEAAVVLFVRRYGRAMRRRAGGAARTDPGACSRCWRRSRHWSPRTPSAPRTRSASSSSPHPLPLAYAALRAAAVRPGDVVLEPSAGTGMLAVMAECALGNRARGALHLNEIAAVRAGLLFALFAGSSVTRHNAERALPTAWPTSGPLSC